MEYVVLFFTHSGAIKFQRKCKKDDIDCELMPVPRRLSSNCSISAKIEFDGIIDDLIDDEIEKVFLLEQGEYSLVHEME